MNALDSGVYAVPEAARLLGIPNQRMRGWIAGYTNTNAAPIIKNELKTVDGKVALSFVNLMEARFIQSFSAQGIHLNSLRLMADEAKSFLESEHPFATNTIFKTDGKKIMAEVVDKLKDEDKKLYDLKTKNWAFWKVLASGLIEGVEFDPEKLARSWVPRPQISKKIILHRTKSFGQPVFKDSGVPTRALYDAFQANGETYTSVARWYEIKDSDVKAAVRFERDIQKAA